jgi:hypothetical protein
MNSACVMGALYNMGRNESHTVLDEKSKLDLKLVITLLGLGIGGIWWAATVQAKLDEGLRNQIAQLAAINTMTTALTAQDKEIAALKKQVEVFESFGTPFAREVSARLESLERKLKP